LRYLNSQCFLRISGKALTACGQSSFKFQRSREKGSEGSNLEKAGGGGCGWFSHCMLEKNSTSISKGLKCGNFQNSKGEDKPKLSTGLVESFNSTGSIVRIGPVQIEYLQPVQAKLSWFDEIG
jgi:hypothetical protein